MNIFVLAFAIKDNNDDVSCEIVDRLFLSMDSAHKFAEQFIVEFKNGFLLRMNPPVSRGYTGSAYDEESEKYFCEHFTIDYTVQSFEVSD